MQQHYLNKIILTLLASLLFACQESTDSFFSGRLSEMDMVHNRIIAGPPETMIQLLKVPARFPDATEAQIANWQGSVIAWWGHPEKQKLMLASFDRISAEELCRLNGWVGVRYKYMAKDAYQVLNEIEAVLITAGCPIL